MSCGGNCQCNCEKQEGAKLFCEVVQEKGSTNSDACACGKEWKDCCKNPNNR